MEKSRKTVKKLKIWENILVWCGLKYNENQQKSATLKKYGFLKPPKMDFIRAENPEFYAVENQNSMPQKTGIICRRKSKLYAVEIQNSMPQKIKILCRRKLEFYAVENQNYMPQKIKILCRRKSKYYAI